MRITTNPSVVRHFILQGVTELAKVTGVTYGPQGRNVLLDRSRGILATRDGVSVAWEVNPAHPLQRLGVRALQDACAKVNKLTGDGTTTTALLTYAILVESHKEIAAGLNPAVLAKDLQQIEHELLEVLVPDPADNFLHGLALHASHGDQEVADAILQALDLVGVHGLISIEEGKGRGVEIVPKHGLEIPRGLESTEFLPSGENSRCLDTSLIALVDGQLHRLSDVSNLIEQATQFPYPLVVISRGCYGEALQVFCMNDRKLECSGGRRFECVVVRVPGRLDQQQAWLADLSAITGAAILDPAITDLKSCSSEVLGSVQSCVLTSTTSTFVAFEDKYENIERRVQELVHERERTSYSYDIEQLNERIAKLTDGFCVMRVGATTQTEMRERRGRIEDALSSVRCAIRGGVVPGGGVAYLALGRYLLDLGVGSSGAGKVLARALRVPLEILARNAGHMPPVILDRVLKATGGVSGGKWLGWDARTNQMRDFRQDPVILDPVEVVHAVVSTAISTASTLLTAEVAITVKGSQ